MPYLTDDVQASIESLLDSDVPTNYISRNADINLSIVSRLRNGHIELRNMKWFNIKNLYMLSVTLKVDDK